MCSDHISKIKIVCVGFERTGTTSIYKALSDLGFKTVTGSKVLMREFVKNKESKHIIEIIEENDAFCDIPWCFLYDTFLEKYPDSYFIHSLRDEDDWFKSYYHQFRFRYGITQKHTFGKNLKLKNSNYFIKRYKEHNNQVEGYLREKHAKYLQINLFEDIDVYGELCSFLGLNPPNKAFPHLNRTKYKSLNLFARKINLLIWDVIRWFKFFVKHKLSQIKRTLQLL